MILFMIKSIQSEVAKRVFYLSSKSWRIIARARYGLRLACHALVCSTPNRTSLLRWFLDAAASPWRLSGWRLWSAPCWICLKSTGVNTGRVSVFGWVCPWWNRCWNRLVIRPNTDWWPSPLLSWSGRFRLLCG